MRMPGLPDVEISVNELVWHLSSPFWSVNRVPSTTGEIDLGARRQRQNQFARLDA